MLSLRDGDGGLSPSGTRFQGGLDLPRQERLEVPASGTRSAQAGNPEEAQTKKNPDRELYTGSAIEVYPNTLSVVSGDELTLHVSTRARRFHLQIARIGLEEKTVWTRNDLPGRFHPTPDDAWERGCRWPASVRLDIPANWESGYYQIKAITADADTPSELSLAFVVVRAAESKAKVLLVLTTSTYGAYNNYGGGNFYGTKSGGRGVMGDGGEHKVSFQRPWMPGFLWKPESFCYAREMRDLTDLNNVDERLVNTRSGLSLWSHSAGFHNWERVMVLWLERNGYPIDYAISSDLEFRPQLLARYRLMLSVGHDEYWSWGMRDAVESFIARGGNACFFSGNTAFWQIRYQDGGASMVCYKHDYRDDPYFKAGRKQLTATHWSSHHIARPETRMTGLSTVYGGFSGTYRAAGKGRHGAGGYLIYRPEHWVFKETGLIYGDCLGQASTIVNFEVDGCPIRMEGGLPVPASDYDGPPSLEILGLHPASFPYGSMPEFAKQVFGDTNPKAAERVAGNRNHAVMSLYTENGTVFSAGTTDWTRGLTGQDPAVERVTQNLLDRLSV